MATTKQLPWVLRISLLLNLIPFSMGLQINSPDPSALATVDFAGTPTCPQIPGLYIELCGAGVPLISTPQFVKIGWNCLQTRQSGSNCEVCLCSMFDFNHHLQDMVYALYEIYFRGGDAGRVIGEKMLGNIPLDEFVTNPDPLSGVEILPVQRLNDLANVDTTKDMAWDIQECLRGVPISGLSLTDEESQDVEEANLQRWSSCYAQRLTERKDAEEANLQRWSSDYVQETWLSPSIAFDILTELSYTTQDLGRSPRGWAIKMILYANAAGIPSNGQLCEVWVRFEPSLRRDIPIPGWTTRMVDFLDDVDEMYPIWKARKQG